MEISYGAHQSVLLEECLRFLTESAPLPTATSPSSPVFFADMTFGAGGHTRALAQSIEEGCVFAVDQDPQAWQQGQQSLKEWQLEQKVQLLHMNFAQFPQWWQQNKPHHYLQGILLDLGVSSHQFDTGPRGFSFREDAPLDMRMNINDDELATASDYLQELSEKELADLFYQFGEEHLSRRIARSIVEHRQHSPLLRTKDLADLIFSSYPKKLRHGKKHPATKCFQALRIAVNRELEVLQEVLSQLFPLLAPGGRLLIISFHSLEDRIVKRELLKIHQNDREGSRILTKKPLVPSEDEIKRNIRARSAKLRVIERTNTTSL